MSIARVVIGSGYGDEGKGLAVDALAFAHARPGLAVRFNGGAQAGHTVTLADGRRHVFSHFGAATLAGWPTLLSRFFVCHPILFLREWTALRRLDVMPRALVDRSSPVTTPFDMLLNQWAEDHRGAARHGSVGVGFGETIERSLSPPHTLTVGDLADTDALRTRLAAIRASWAPARRAALGLGAMSEAEAALLCDDALIERFVEDCSAFLDRIEVVDGTAALAGATDVIFEGAQGLLLDQDRGAFPHVTRSNTGLTNVVTLAAEAGLEGLDVAYMTRAYATRHGAGWFANAWTAPRPGVRDSTNLPHAYQGRIRFGWLDLDVLQAAIRTDLDDARSRGLMPIEHRLAMTCLDQADERWGWIESGELLRGSVEALAHAAQAMIGGSPAWTSWGPTRGEVAGLALCNGRRMVQRAMATA